MRHLAEEEKNTVNQEAYKFVDQMIKKADGNINMFYPYWHGWALRKAFEAGYKFCKREYFRKKKRKK